MNARARLTALGMLLLFVGPAVAADPPIEPTPGYRHDGFVTEPQNHAIEFQAYISGFDTSDDDDGDGTPDLWGVPQWVAYDRDHEHIRRDGWLLQPQLRGWVPLDCILVGLTQGGEELQPSRFFDGIDADQELGMVHSRR